MTEAHLLAAVKDLARLWGLLVYHTRDSRGSDPGFPDLVIVGPCGVLFRELKSQAGQLTRPQGLWRDGLRDGGANWGLWRPEDWRNGQVAAELRGLWSGVLPRGGAT